MINTDEELAELKEYQQSAEETLERLSYQLNRAYIKDKTGREIMRGDKVTGLFYQGLSVVGTCVFSRQEAAWGVEWMRGGTKEFVAFCKCCNVEWEVIEK